MSLSFKRHEECRRVMESQLSEYEKGRLCWIISNMNESELYSFSAANTAEEMRAFIDRDENGNHADDEVPPFCCCWFWPWSF